MTGQQQDQVQTVSREAWASLLDQPCPTHEDATAGIPCQLVRTHGRLRAAICADRTKEANR